MNSIATFRIDRVSSSRMCVRSQLLKSRFSTNLKHVRYIAKRQMTMSHLSARLLSQLHSVQRRSLLAATHTTKQRKRRPRPWPMSEGTSQQVNLFIEPISVTSTSDLTPSRFLVDPELLHPEPRLGAHAVSAYGRAVHSRVSSDKLLSAYARSLVRYSVYWMYGCA